MFVDLLYAVSYKNVKASGHIADVAHHYLAVRPKELCNLFLIKLWYKPLTHSDYTTAAVNSRRGMVTGFRGATRAFPITKEQWV